jgi:hypothetical protein
MGLTLLLRHSYALHAEAVKRIWLAFYCAGISLFRTYVRANEWCRWRDSARLVLAVSWARKCEQERSLPPLRGLFLSASCPTACAVGCILTPLRG